MYKKLAAWTALLFLLSAVWGAAPARAEAPIKVVTTTFPLYDWTRQVLGDRVNAVELALVQESGVDLHNFQPTVQDIVKVSSADVFVYVGGPSDAWVQDALKEVANKDMRALNLMAALGDAVKQDVTVEGMQESAHHHDHEGQEHEGHDHEAEAGHDHADEEHEEHEEHEEGVRTHAHADEHIWLSLRNAQTLVDAIAHAISEADPAHRDTYTQNAAAYNARLKELDGRFIQTVSAANAPVLLFGDRFPFRYMMDDYGITYYAAFAGCSAETEASFQTIAFLAGKVDELGLKAVMTLDGSDGRLAQAVVRTSEHRDQRVLVLNAMQSINRADIENGATYLSIMEDNLKALVQAL